jgi:hypothetical protein
MNVRMKRIGLIGACLWIAWLFSLPKTWALSQDEIRNEIRSQMSQRHPEPPGPFWERLGAEALPVIRQMYQETKSSYEKSWLIDGLSHFSDPSVGELLRSDAEKEQNSVMKKKLLSAYVCSQGDASLEFIEPHLSSPDPHIRKALALAIRDHVSPNKAGPMLARFRANEKEDWVVRVLDEQADPSLLKRKRPETLASVSVPSMNGAKTSNQTALKPLSEKELAGEWRGIEVGPRRTGKVKVVFYIAEDPKAPKWKVEWAIPGKSKRIYVQPEFEWNTFQTAQDHWLEIRIKHEDTVFLSRKPGKK